MNDAYEDALTGNADPGALVLPLSTIRSLAGNSARADVMDFLRANSTEDGGRTVMLTHDRIQFV